MTESQKPEVTSALKLLRGLPWKNATNNLANLIELCPDLSNDILDKVNQPFRVQTDPQTGQDYILCSYNRFRNSYRSPWSNTYYPPVKDARNLSKQYRQLEIDFNDAFPVYCNLYYGGALSSVYFSNTHNQLKAIICIKKDADPIGRVQGSWEAMHIAEISVLDTKTPSKFHYKLISTVMTWIETAESSGKFELCGSITKETETLGTVYHDLAHLFNIGKLVEDQECHLRSLLTDVYFGKTRHILTGLRSVFPCNDIENRREFADDLQKNLDDMDLDLSSY